MSLSKKTNDSSVLDKHLKTMPDFSKEPFKEWCPECEEWVHSLAGHCINNDSHRTSVLLAHEIEDCLKGDELRVVSKEPKPDTISERASVPHESKAFSIRHRHGKVGFSN